MSRAELFEVIRRDKREEGLSVHALARRHRVHRRTVRSPRRCRQPASCRRGLPTCSVRNQATMHAWLTDDLSAPRKQRRTARRIWERLVDERGTSVAPSTVRAYVGEVRRELESAARLVSVPHTHPPGDEAEVDFGEIAVWLDGELARLAMFVMRLSHSGRAIHVCLASEGPGEADIPEDCLSRVISRNIVLVLRRNPRRQDWRGLHNTKPKGEPLD